MVISTSLAQTFLPKWWCCRTRTFREQLQLNPQSEAGKPCSCWRVGWLLLVPAPAVWSSACADIWRIPLTFEAVALGNGGASFVSAHSTLRVSRDVSAGRGQRGDAPDLACRFDQRRSTFAAHPLRQHKTELSGGFRASFSAWFFSAFSLTPTLFPLFSLSLMQVLLRFFLP